VNSTVTENTDDLELFKKLMQRPKFAWPTILLLVGAIAIFGLSTYACIAGTLPLGWAMLLNAIASYMAFPVAHDATHSAVCSNRKLNDWAGRISMLLLEPGPFFPVFRFIHMQHHRFTNDPVKDPDVYSGMGPKWLLPFRWLTLDFIYFKNYLSPDVFKKRPKKERYEFYFAFVFVVAVVTAMTMAGWLLYYLLLFFIPTRISKFFIIIAFDFLPHYPHDAYAKEEPYRSTSNRVGMEWLLTPLFLYQNYHLVHHLYPAIPFYRYLKIWNVRKQYHEAQNPATTTVFSLTPKNEKGPLKAGQLISGEPIPGKE